MDFINLRESIDILVKKKELNVPKYVVDRTKKYLCQMYVMLDIKEDIPDISHIQNIIHTNPEKISETYFNIIKNMSNNISQKSILTTSSNFRKILEALGMKNHLDAPRIKEEKKSNLLPQKLKKIQKNTLITKFIENRLDYLKKYGKINSEKTIKNMVRYWILILEKIDDIEKLNIENNIPLPENIINIIAKIGGNIKTPLISAGYYLFVDINENWSIKRKTFASMDNNIKDKNKNEEIDGDNHRLSAFEQEILWKMCKTPIEKVIISLLLTTGMRVGGIANIKIKDVIDENNNVKDIGSTIEKGGKIRRFAIFPMAKKCIEEWFKERRKTDSPYLFPSNINETGSCSISFVQNVFYTVAKNANLKGEHIHPHAVRHSVAYNLIESGNTMEQVGNFLGHSDPSTTSKYYVKMSVKEIIKGMDTTCIGGCDMKKNHKPDVPIFSNENNKKKSKRNALSRLKEIKITL